MSESLEKAARVVRDGNRGESSDAEATLQRVLQRSQRLGRRRRRFHLVVAPLLAALVASVAWGASTGQLSSFVSALASKLEQSLTKGGAGRTRSRAPKIQAAPVSPSALDDTRPVPPESLLISESASSTRVHEPAPVGPPGRARARQQPAPSPAVIAPAPSGAPIDADSLYRVAHRAQFESRDYAAAAAAWDRYLEAAPNGTFAPEARWSRAVALVRLGRKAEASVALEPFARGDYGPYRRDEARSLLDVLKK